MNSLKRNLFWLALCTLIVCLNSAHFFECNAKGPLLYETTHRFMPWPQAPISSSEVSFDAVEASEI